MSARRRRRRPSRARDQGHRRGKERDALRRSGGGNGRLRGACDAKHRTVSRRDPCNGMRRPRRETAPCAIERRLGVETRGCRPCGHWIRLDRERQQWSADVVGCSRPSAPTHARELVDSNVAHSSHPTWGLERQQRSSPVAASITSLLCDSPQTVQRSRSRVCSPVPLALVLPTKALESGKRQPRGIARARRSQGLWRTAASTFSNACGSVVWTTKSAILISA